MLVRRPEHPEVFADEFDRRNRALRVEHPLAGRRAIAVGDGLGLHAALLDVDEVADHLDLPIRVAALRFGFEFRLERCDPLDDFGPLHQRTAALVVDFWVLPRRRFLALGETRGRMQAFSGRNECAEPLNISCVRDADAGLRSAAHQSPSLARSAAQSPLPSTAVTRRSAPAATLSSQPRPRQM